MDSFVAPSSVLVLGSGVLGLGAALALTRRPQFSRTAITVVDRSAEAGVFPSPDASSIDSSRIVRSDYADRAYAALAAEAHKQWRKAGDDELGGQGRYRESGMVLIANNHTGAVQEGKKAGIDYVKASWRNVLAISKEEGSAEAGKLKELSGKEEVQRQLGISGDAGDWGYVNQTAGWADAEASMKWLLSKVKETGRVTLINGTAASLDHEGDKVTGALLHDGRHLTADLVIVATGAWTGGLIDLGGQAMATGQVLGYMDITEEEQAQLENKPIVLNMTTGLFVIPPANLQLKVARHAYGYLNPSAIPSSILPSRPNAAVMAGATVSLPLTSVDEPTLSIPLEGEADLRRALKDMVHLQELHDRPFVKTRLCWYTDTATGDFLIDYHPEWKGLFVATGGCGHAFKFLPVLGERIVDCVVGKCPAEFQDKWKWRAISKNEDGTQLYEHIVTEDGSRGGKPGLILKDELKRI